MKRMIAALAALMLMLTGMACAEAAMAELRNMRKSAGDRIQEMEAVPTPVPEDAPEPTPTPDVTFEPLSQGMKGDAVSALQQRLIDLGYLNGKADGNYGGKTQAAVKAFQQAAGLEATGAADDATQKAVFWSEAPVQTVYEKLDYVRVIEAPEAYAGTAVKVTGSVLQLMESDAEPDGRGVYTVMRLATKGDYDNVVYVAYFRAAADEPVAEGDTVTVSGALNGLYRYATEAGGEIALPRLDADVVVQGK